METFKIIIPGSTILKGVKFLIFLLILAWALQQCSSTTHTGREFFLHFFNLKVGGRQVDVWIALYARIYSNYKSGVVESQYLRQSQECCLA